MRIIISPAKQMRVDTGFLCLHGASGFYGENRSPERLDQRSAI